MINEIVPTVALSHSHVVVLEGPEQMFDVFEAEVLREFKSVEEWTLDQLQETELAVYTEAMDGIVAWLARQPVEEAKKKELRARAEADARKDFAFTNQARARYQEASDKIRSRREFVSMADNLLEYPVRNLVVAATPNRIVLDKFRPSLDEYLKALLFPTSGNRAKRVWVSRNRSEVSIEGQRFRVLRNDAAETADPPQTVRWLEQRVMQCRGAFSLIETMRRGFDHKNRSVGSGDAIGAGRACNDLLLRMNNLGVILNEIRSEPCVEYRRKHAQKMKGPRSNASNSTTQATQRERMVRAKFTELRKQDPSMPAAEIRKKLIDHSWQFPSEDNSVRVPKSTIGRYTKGLK